MESAVNPDEQMRSQCLGDAIRSCTVSGFASAAEIVAAAQTYLDFVTGKKPPAKKKAAKKKSARR
jgi:hypothetical protein